MLMGAHESIAGGIYKSLYRAREDTCQALQIFSKNSNRWRAKPLREADRENLEKAKKETKIFRLAIHDSYLINLASPKEDGWKKSMGAFLEEMMRAEFLKIPYLVFHPGSHLGKGLDYGIERIKDALNGLICQTKGFKLKVLLETTAGQGTNIGYRFEQIGKILDGIERKERVGVCFDTCHAFAAGYDIRTEKRYEKTFNDFDEIIGLENLCLFHLNDSKKGLGSRIDRHEHIGKGYIGKEGFKLLVNDERFEEIAGILETAPLSLGENSYKMNLEILRSLLE